MRKRHILLLLAGTALVIGGAPVNQQPKMPGAQKREVKQMNITGGIAKSNYGYIIRGKVPAEIFTILNADPKVLDEFVKSGKTVSLETRIVSGDNVEIMKIDGKEYPQSKESKGK